MSFSHPHLQDTREAGLGLQEALNKRLGCLFLKIAAAVRSQDDGIQTIVLNPTSLREKGPGTVKRQRTACPNSSCQQGET
jgi:hypothetical protein